MPTRKEILKEAYEWEQARLLAWENEMDVHPGADSPIKREFIRIWHEYFAEIRKSNEAVIGVCVAAALTEEAAASDIDEIHDRPRMVKVKNATAAALAESRLKSYFEALDKTVALELQARDKITSFLTTGAP